MTIEIPDDLYALLKQNAMISGVSVDDYLGHLIRYGSPGAVVEYVETDEERAEIDAALAEAEAESDEDSVDADEFLAEFRAKYPL